MLTILIVVAGSATVLVVLLLVIVIIGILASIGLPRFRAVTTRAKALGVHDMAFHKKVGLRIEDMVKSSWIYRKLRNFRAGIESDISCLKRAYGLARCTWRGLGHFRAYVWSSVVAYNLALFARLKPT